MGSIIGHTIDYNGSRFWEASGTYPAKNDQSSPTTPPPRALSCPKRGVQGTARHTNWLRKNHGIIFRFVTNSKGLVIKRKGKMGSKTHSRLQSLRLWLRALAVGNSTYVRIRVAINPHSARSSLQNQMLPSTITFYIFERCAPSFYKSWRHHVCSYFSSVVNPTKW